MTGCLRSQALGQDRHSGGLGRATVEVTPRAGGGDVARAPQPGLLGGHATVPSAVLLGVVT